jgi:hypothetical protein
MTIGEFIKSLPNAHRLSDDDMLRITLGIYFAKARDQYGIPLICFMDARAVRKFVRTLRAAGYHGCIPLQC